SDQDVLTVGACALRAGRVGAYIGAALALGHRHPEESSLLGPGGAKAGVVLERGQEWLPLGGEPRRLAERGDRRVGHGDRASMPALDLRPDVEGRRARRVGARPRLAPREGMQAMADGDLHELVPRGMELHLVDAFPEAVVRAQARRI